MVHYGRPLIKRVIHGIVCVIEEERCDSRHAGQRVHGSIVSSEAGV